MVNADEDLKEERNKKNPRLTKAKKIKLKKKTVAKIPNRYQTGGFLEDPISNID